MQEHTEAYEHDAAAIPGSSDVEFGNTIFQGGIQPRELQLEQELVTAREELAAVREKLQETERALQDAQRGDGGTGFRTTTTKPTWPFRVSPFRTDLPQLKVLEGQFVDEGEAIRCFWRQNNGVKGLDHNGKTITLDALNVNVKCDCLQPAKRKASIAAQYRPKTEEDLMPVQ